MEEFKNFGKLWLSEKLTRKYEAMVKQFRKILRLWTNLEKVWHYFYKILEITRKIDCGKMLKAIFPYIFEPFGRNFEESWKKCFRNFKTLLKGLEILKKCDHGRSFKKVWSNFKEILGSILRKLPLDLNLFQNFLKTSK